MYINVLDTTTIDYVCNAIQVTTSPVKANASPITVYTTISILIFAVSASMATHSIVTPMSVLLNYPIAINHAASAIVSNVSVDIYHYKVYAMLSFLLVCNTIKTTDGVKVAPKDIISLLMDNVEYFL